MCYNSSARAEWPSSSFKLLPQHFQPPAVPCISSTPTSTFNPLKHITFICWDRWGPYTCLLGPWYTCLLDHWGTLYKRDGMMSRIFIFIIDIGPNPRHCHDFAWTVLKTPHEDLKHFSWSRFSQGINNDGLLEQAGFNYLCVYVSVFVLECGCVCIVNVHSWMWVSEFSVTTFSNIRVKFVRHTLWYTFTIGINVHIFVA